MDDVSVWDGALSAAEVGGLYTRGLAGLNAAQIPEPGVIGLIGVGALLALRRRR